MALIRVRNEADYLASNHTKQSLRPQQSLGAQIEALPLPRERFSPLAGCRHLPAPTPRGGTLDAVTPVQSVAKCLKLLQRCHRDVEMPIGVGSIP